MSTYAIGDVQGCYDELQQLLGRIAFDPTRDKLWFAGDLVNRGPLSAEVLRFVRSLGERAVTVLGNHDLHLLALGAGAAGPRPPGSLASVLAAGDRDELLGWLCRQPLLHHDTTLDFTLVHAGIAPPWDLAQASAHAREVEAVLRSDKAAAFLSLMYGDGPAHWTPRLSRMERLRYIVNAFTRMRYVHIEDGGLALRPSKRPGRQPHGLVPWFQARQRRARDHRIVFGHWSTLGQVAWPQERVWCIDTGAVWGGRLTALRLEDQRLFSVPSRGYRTPN